MVIVFVNCSRWRLNVGHGRTLLPPAGKLLLMPLMGPLTAAPVDVMMPGPVQLQVLVINDA